MKFVRLEQKRDGLIFFFLASRFALLEIKVVVFHLVKNFELVVVEETQIPFKLSTRNINITTDKGYWMGLKRRTKHN